MLLEAEPLALHLRTPFRVSYGASTQRTNVLLRLGEGVGEGALPPYYPHRLEDVLSYLKVLDPDKLLHAALEDALRSLPPGPAPARCAADIALHDHWAKELGYPLYRLWGLDPAKAPPSSLTLSIPENPDALRRQVQDARGWPLLKLKLGAGSPETDEALVQAVRSETDQPLCVDANGAWSLEEAARIIPRLADYDLTFIEQPLPAGEQERWRALRSRLPSGLPPLIADESVQGIKDLQALAGAADGVNIKLTKSGGLREARRMIEVARALDLKVLLGCMIESAVGVTAAAHLAPLADYADLDGNLFVADDPFAGALLEQGKLTLPGGPGLGVVLRSAITH